MPAKDTTRREPWNPLLKGYPFSEKVNAISVGAETLFTRLVAQADDYGNYYGNPRKILAYLYGHRFASGEVTATDTGRWRTELVSNTVGPLAAMYTVNGAEYIHLINSRRRFRSDVTPDERFPREPANIEEQATFEHVTRTGRKRTVNVPLDPDPDLDADQDLEEPSSKNDSESYPTKKGRKLTGDKLAWFIEFMDAFAYKKGKAAAADSWLDIKGLDRALADAIVSGAKKEAIRRAGLREDQTPKMAQGWLTDRRWEDDYSEAAVGNQRGAAYYENARKPTGASDADQYQAGFEQRREEQRERERKREEAGDG